MLAPFGVGVLYAKEHLLQRSLPFLYGGDMIAEGRVAPDEVLYNDLPWKHAAGTPTFSARSSRPRRSGCWSTSWTQPVGPGTSTQSSRCPDPWSSRPWVPFVHTPRCSPRRRSQDYATSPGSVCTGRRIHTRARPWPRSTSKG
ncbi:MAG: aminotransferase class V-fold PLP-dependent enzyme [Nocardioides sp.]|nr:aminotransferase class V-fold PLP-dependent enzyme [Nocardioides sp.]